MSSETGTILDHRALYYRWEKEQWEAGKIGLAADRAGWTLLDPAAQSRVMRDLLMLLVIKAHLTGTLVPLVDGIEGEEAQVYLATELVDEARHAVFVDRVLSEIVSPSACSMEERVLASGAALPPAMDRLLTSATEASSALRDGSGAPAACVALIHLGIKGGIVQTLVGSLASHAAGLPGISEGISLVARDEARHLDFARAFLTHSVSSGGSAPDSLREIAGSLRGLSEELLGSSAPGAEIAIERHLEAIAPAATR